MCGVDVTSHRLALDLLEAWRSTARARRPAAVSRRLGWVLRATAELTLDNGP